MRIDAKKPPCRQESNPHKTSVCIKVATPNRSAIGLTNFHDKLSSISARHRTRLASCQDPNGPNVQSALAVAAAEKDSWKYGKYKEKNVTINIRFFSQYTYVFYLCSFLPDPNKLFRDIRLQLKLHY